jgi:hypothetical protein
VTKDNIPKSKIPEAIDALRALGAKELDDVPAREAIRKMRRQIERVLRLGYSYEEVSKTLASLDINISAERIRYLLNDIKRSTRKKSVSPPIPEDSNTQVIDEQTLAENSATQLGSIQSVKKSKSQSQRQSNLEPKSAKSKSTRPKTTKTDNQPEESNSNNHQNFSRPAFVPQIMSDEDL